MNLLQRATTAMVVAGAILGAWAVLPAQSSGGESTPITEGSNVTIMYHITVPGEAFDMKDISQFVQGRHQLLPALEQQITGMKSGEEKQVELSPEEGFGPYDQNKKKTVLRKQLPAGTKEGDILKDRSDNQATVTHLSDNDAVLDYNHPLAGKPLKITLKILRVDGPAS